MLRIELDWLIKPNGILTDCSGKSVAAFVVSSRLHFVRVAIAHLLTNMPLMSGVPFASTAVEEDRGKQ